MWKHQINEKQGIFPLSKFYNSSITEWKCSSIFYSTKNSKIQFANDKCPQTGSKQTLNKARDVKTGFAWEISQRQRLWRRKRKTDYLNRHLGNKWKG